ncbi:MAG TPA: DNA-binding response regulator, partial [Paludibacter sp.]|nr:DNA-binding response regulator [Paludibacter sp.]
MNSYRILVVDDEEDLCEILQFNLETDGYHV